MKEIIFMIALCVFYSNLDNDVPTKVISGMVVVGAAYEILADTTTTGETWNLNQDEK